MNLNGSSHTPTVWLCRVANSKVEALPIATRDEALSLDLVDFDYLDDSEVALLARDTSEIGGQCLCLAVIKKLNGLQSGGSSVLAMIALDSLQWEQAIDQVTVKVRSQTFTPVMKTLIWNHRPNPCHYRA